VLLLL
jgi:putative transposase